MNMKVAIDGIQCIVKWRHNSQNNVQFIEGEKVKPLSTQCLIYVLVDGKKELFKQTEALCSYTDKFNKQKGRIVSLTRAIKSYPKEQRKLFWDSYGKEIGY